MARNEEKSHSMLNRWLQLERMGGPGAPKPKERKTRPHLVEECHDVAEAANWRLEVVKEIGKNVLLIQNGVFQPATTSHSVASLEEHKIRDLNDLINKLLREKKHWERRINELGGSDFGVR